MGIELLAILNVQRININLRSNGPAMESKDGQTKGLANLYLYSIKVLKLQGLSFVCDRRIFPSIGGLTVFAFKA